MPGRSQIGEVACQLLRLAVADHERRGEEVGRHATLPLRRDSDVVVLDVMDDGIDHDPQARSEAWACGTCASARSIADGCLAA